MPNAQNGNQQASQNPGDSFFRYRAFLSAGKFLSLLGLQVFAHHLRQLCERCPEVRTGFARCVLTRDHDDRPREVDL